MRLLRKKILGQSAVEAMLALPVMLLVYLVGAHMWTLTWNAQYAHVKARLELHDDANHRPCSVGDNPISGQLEGNASATTRDMEYMGGRFNAFKGRTMKAKYVIVCG